MSKKVLFLFSFVFAFFVLIGVKEAVAQGAYTCNCTADTFGGANCDTSSSNCDQNYRPNCSNCAPYTSPSYCTTNPSSLLCGGSFNDNCILGVRQPPGSACTCSGDCLINSFCSIPIGQTSGTCVQCCNSVSDCPAIPNRVVSGCVPDQSSGCYSGRICTYTAAPTPTPASGTFTCFCHSNTLGGWNCSFTNNCALGYVPNLEYCPTYTPNEEFVDPSGCRPYITTCTNSCVVANPTVPPGGSGCTDDTDCPTGYFCNTPDIPVPGGVYSCLHCCTYSSDCPSANGFNSLCNERVSTSHCSSGLACSIPQSVTQPPIACGSFGEPCCEGARCDTSLGLSCNIEENLCLGERGCTCIPSDTCSVDPNNMCGWGYIDDCSSRGPACGGTSMCECIVNYEPPSGVVNFSRLYQAIQSGRGLFSFSSSLTLGEIVSNALVIIFPIAGLVLLLMLIYGGYNLMFSAGDPKKAQASKEIITTSLIGFAIIFIAFWLTIVVGRILGITDILGIF